MKMLEILKDIQEMPYYKNYAAVSGAVHNIANHEKAVEDVFCKHGLEKNTIRYTNSKSKGTVSKEQRYDWLSGGDHSILPDNTYISQPCGSNASPDFIVKVDGKIYFIECKSADGPGPVFNSVYPQDGYIYIFSSMKYNATTIFRGEDIVTPEAAKLYDDRQRAHALVDQEHDRILLESGADRYNRGLSYYNREMYTQSGSKDKTDYFTHYDRARCEQRVLDLAS